MILSKRVALGGVQLDEVNSKIIIRGINTGVPHEDLQAVNRMGGWGQRITMQHWNSLDVAVTFAIDVPKRELQLRRTIWEDVVTWALRAGWLTVNYMPERRLYVDKVILPGSGDLWAWRDDFTITFRAYSVPFWQDETAVEVRKNRISSGSVQIDIGGTAPGVLDLTFENASGATNTNVKFTVDGKALELRGVNLAASETLQVYHTNDGFLRARAGSRNVYSLLRGADDAYVQPGTTVTVEVSATRAGNLVVQNFARWL